MAYIDTSVLAAYYCPEPLSAAAQVEIRSLASPTLSRLVEVELYSAVALKVRIGELDTASANQITTLFSGHLAASYYRLVAVETKEYGLARDWLSRFSTPLRTLDALHLAAAFSNGLLILTSDKGLAESARLLGVAHRLIQ